MNYFTKEFINSIPKIINSNGCWISTKNSPTANGYVKVSRQSLYLHRLVMCIYYDIDYNNQKIVSRHSQNCDKACFFYEHLKPGSNTDNEQDKIEHGRNFNSSKLVCPNCGGPYSIRITKTGWTRGEVHRECLICKRIRRLERENQK